MRLLSRIEISFIGGFALSVSAFTVERTRRSFVVDDRRSTTTTARFVKPEKESIVELECTLRPEGDFIPEPLIDGIVLDTSDPPRHLVFVLGEGNYLPGLHDLIFDMEVGSQVEDVSLDAGWGEWNPSLNISASFESVKSSGLDSSQIQVGTELVLANGMGAIVTHVDDETFVIDANPPLAGSSYLANVKLLSVDCGPSDFLYAPEANADCKYQVATVALGKSKVWRNLSLLSSRCDC